MEKLKNIIHTGCDNCGYVQPCNRCKNGNYEKWIPNKINDTAIAGKPPTGTTEDAKHYQVSDKQPIEIMQDFLNNEQFAGFLMGNVIKYALRMNHKGKIREDAGKCSQYAKWLCEVMDGRTIVPGGAKK